MGYTRTGGTHQKPLMTPGNGPNVPSPKVPSPAHGGRLGWGASASERPNSANDRAMPATNPHQPARQQGRPHPNPPPCAGEGKWAIRARGGPTKNLAKSLPPRNGAFQCPLPAHGASPFPRARGKVRMGAKPSPASGAAKSQFRKRLRAMPATGHSATPTNRARGSRDAPRARGLRSPTSLPSAQGRENGPLTLRVLRARGTLAYPNPPPFPPKTSHAS